MGQGQHSCGLELNASLTSVRDVVYFQCPDSPLEDEVNGLPLLHHHKDDSKDKEDCPSEHGQRKGMVRRPGWKVISFKEKQEPLIPCPEELDPVGDTSGSAQASCNDDSLGQV
ncbi:hypothetical protein P7K49_019017 [Saguinus oedipus]|uniref:Uncharacterized protein n=1 Tax=Saguinus oedipus TaxID=9490 RepID=A0ABQ9UW76_SAGOE|nr:hypothetical protein P7K49_019017 [Saguinus oedipus]